MCGQISHRWIPQHTHHLFKIILNVHRHLEESACAVLQNRTTVAPGEQDDQSPSVGMSHETMQLSGELIKAAALVIHWIPVGLKLPE